MHTRSYQLDTWHLASHPSYWPVDVAEVEAELMEGHLTVSSDPRTVVTELGEGAAHGGDFTNFTTCVLAAAILLDEPLPLVHTV